MFGGCLKLQKFPCGTIHKAFTFLVWDVCTTAYVLAAPVSSVTFSSKSSCEICSSGIPHLSHRSCSISLKQVDCCKNGCEGKTADVLPRTPYTPACHQHCAQGNGQRQHGGIPPSSACGDMKPTSVLLVSYFLHTRWPFHSLKLAAKFKMNKVKFSIFNKKG